MKNHAMRTRNGAGIVVLTTHSKNLRIYVKIELSEQGKIPSF